MKKLRKVLGLVIAGVMALSFSVVAQADEEGVSFTGTLSSETVEQGKEFTMDINLDYNSGVWGYGFDVTYDNTKVVPLGFVKGSRFASGILCGVLEDPSINPAERNSLRIVYNNPDLSNNFDTGNIAVITFVALADAEGQVPIDIVPCNGDNINFDGNDVPTVANGVVVNIVEAQTTTTTTTTTTEPTTQTTTKATQTTTKATQNTTKYTTESTSETTTDDSTETTTKKSSGSSSKATIVVNGNLTTTVTTEATTEETTKAVEATTVGATPKTIKVAIGKKSVDINGNNSEMDAAAYIQSSSNSTMVPLRFVAIAIGNGNVENADKNSNIVWDSAKKSATITYNGKTIVFNNGSNKMTVNGKTEALDNGAIAEIKDNRMYIPFRALGKALGVNVEWDSATKTAIYTV